MVFTDDSHTQLMAILQKSSERLENISKTAESLISADAASDAIAQVTKMYGLLEMYEKRHASGAADLSTQIMSLKNEIQKLEGEMFAIDNDADDDDDDDDANL